MSLERGMEMDSPLFREADIIAFSVFSGVFRGLFYNYFIPNNRAVMYSNKVTKINPVKDLCG